MKVLRLSILALLLAGCGIGGEKRNIQIQSNGLSVSKDYLMVDNVISQESEFISGSEIIYKLEGVTGFSLKDDKAIFGCSMIVTDQSNNKEVMHYDDLFAENKAGYSKEEASLLNFTLAIGSPMVVGGHYLWSLHLWDKRGKAELTATMPFTVGEGKDLVGIKTESKGLIPAKVYIISNGSLKSTDVKLEQKLTLYFDGIKGFSIQPDSTVTIGASMVVTDKDGENVLEYSDLFQANPVMPLATSKSLTLYLQVGNPMKTGETYLWKLKVWDKNNQNSVESSISINVQAKD